MISDLLENAFLYAAEPGWDPDTDACIKRTAGD